MVDGDLDDLSGLSANGSSDPSAGMAGDRQMGEKVYSGMVKYLSDTENRMAQGFAANLAASVNTDCRTLEYSWKPRQP